MTTAEAGRSSPARCARPQMTWLLWRQHRGEALVAAIVIAVLAIALTPATLHMHQLADVLGRDGCLGGHPDVTCNGTMDAFNAASGTLRGILPLLNFVPALAGMFIGAPLVAREFETGTWRLAWSQSITRRSWLRAQLFGALAVTAVAAVLLTVVTTWVVVPLNYVQGRFTSGGFGLYGVIPLTWSLLAFAVGVLAGAATRRVIPAVAAALAGYLAIRLPVEFLLRPRYLTPLKMWNVPFSLTGPISHDAWELDVAPVAPGARILTSDQFSQVQHQAEVAIPRNANTSPSAYFAEVNHWITAHGYTQVVTYQPADRFWAFQGIEAGLCLVLAFTAIGVACPLVLRRHSPGFGLLRIFSIQHQR